MHNALGKGFESIRIEVKKFKMGELAMAWIEEAKLCSLQAKAEAQTTQQNK